jgi:ATP-binding protein involved in chromosome partitioning
MLHSVIQQFLRGCDWGELDHLVIDLPPGTGDVALSLIQTAPLTGAIVVTTPSDVSLEDARKAVNMFRQVNVEILGLVENMSYLIAPQSGERIDVFGSGGGQRMAASMAIPLIAELPLDPSVRKGGDSGAAVSWNDDAHSAPFLELAKKVSIRLEETVSSAPSITIED